MKRCSRCRNDRPLNEFCKWKRSKDGLHYWCAACRKEKYVERIEYTKAWYQANKARVSENSKRWKSENRERAKQTRSRWEKARRKSDRTWAEMQVLRARLREFLSTKNARKSGRFADLLGCTPKQLRQYLEFQFEDGMTWENRHLWEIDHIIPVSWADPSDPWTMQVVFHFSNLRPLWREENRRKSNHMIAV